MSEQNTTESPRPLSDATSVTAQKMASDIFHLTQQAETRKATDQEILNQLSQINQTLLQMLEQLTLTNQMIWEEDGSGEDEGPMYLATPTH